MRMYASYFLEPLSEVPQSTSDERLESILGLTSSSHEPVFVFDKQGKFLGLVSPYSALYKIHFPYSTKASSALIIPPRLDANTDLLSVVSHMLSTRFYTLPVFAKGDKVQVIGVVRAKKILEYVAFASQDLLEAVAEKLTIGGPITIGNGELVEDAYKKLRQEDISRLIVINEKGGLAGILTRNDLKKAFIAPSPRQRFSKLSGDSGQMAFDEEEFKRSDLPIRNLFVTDVETIDSSADRVSIVQNLVRSGRNSIVIVNHNLRPVGFVSNRDLLLAILTVFQPENDAPIIMEKPKFVSAFVIEEIYRVLNNMGIKIAPRLPLQRFEISFKEGKIGIGRPTLIETTLGAKFYTGEDFVVKTKSYEILVGVRKAVDRIYKKARKSLSKRKKWL